MSEVLEIQLRASDRKPGPGKPPVMQAWLGDEMLCEHRTPICAAARVLVARGMAHAVMTVRSISGVLAFSATPVAQWAKLTVSEDDRNMPRWKRFRPFEGSKFSAKQERSAP
jgi:hypothetical protein